MLNHSRFEAESTNSQVEEELVQLLNIQIMNVIGSLLHLITKKTDNNPVELTRDRE